MHLIAIGRLRAGPELALFERYNARLRPRLAVVELPEQRGTRSEVRRREGAALLAALPRGGFRVPLDLGGEAASSEAFARRLGQWTEQARAVCFLIGGAEGLDAAVLDQADHVLSLGPMTWPHFMVRGLLAEQVYRAQAIRQGHPYHKATRPEA